MAAETDIVIETPVLEGAPKARKGLSFSFARRHGVMIRDLGPDGGTAVYRGGASPIALAEARRFAGVPLQLRRVSNEEFDALLQAFYGQDNTKASQMVDGLDEEFDLTAVAQELQEPSDLLESDDDAPIIRFINAVLTEAIKENASDIHIEPYENRLGVRFRVDGVLREVLHTRRALAPLVVAILFTVQTLGELTDNARRSTRTVMEVSRLGQGSRVVLTHDVAQRDNLRVGRHDGVVSVIEALKGHPIFGHVTLTRSERSEIAAVVTDLLDGPLQG